MLAAYDNELLTSSKFSLCEYLRKRKTNSMWDEELLARAKTSLTKRLSFFGLTDHQEQSRRLLERTFKGRLAFDESVEHRTSGVWNARKSTDQLLSELDEHVVQRIRQMNSLDVRLYEFARELFVKRLQYFKII
jgi:hypothetical protein